MERANKEIQELKSKLKEYEQKITDFQNTMTQSTTL
jgi:peptidoglycan hydrolase CwlO-like protein